MALLLTVLAEGPGELSLTAVAERMRLPVSTTHRLLHLLVEEGFVDRGAAKGSYQPGLEFLRVGGLVSSRADLTAVAQPFMQAVVDACDETCMLSVYQPRSGSAMITKVIYGSHPLRYEAALYQPGSLVWGATGRGILAFLPPATIDAIVAREGPSPADPRQVVKPATVKRELARIRQQGYAHTRGQKVRGAEGIAAPIYNATGVAAALCLTIPDSRFEPAMEGRFASTLMQQAARLSAALGWRGEGHGA